MILIMVSPVMALGHLQIIFRLANQEEHLDSCRIQDFPEYQTKKIIHNNEFQEFP